MTAWSVVNTYYTLAFSLSSAQEGKVRPWGKLVAQTGRTPKSARSELSSLISK